MPKGKKDKPDHSSSANIMRAIFHDRDDGYSYDQSIENARKIMEDCTPCQSVRELDWLINRLEQHKSEYSRRPCVEGFCLSSLFKFMTPHRSRITRRINVLRGERDIHGTSCEDFKKTEQDERNKNHEILLQERQLSADKDMFKSEIDARANSKTITSTIKTEEGIQNDNTLYRPRQ
jgi:hypothetical protein